jgi:hypothetical protein
MLAKNPAERPAAREVAPVLEPLIAALPSRLTVSRRGIRALVNFKDLMAARPPPPARGEPPAALEVPAESGARLEILYRTK